MRQLLLLMTAALLLTSTAHASAANVCAGDRTITSQAHLNAFIAEGCTTLSGSLLFDNSSDITSFAGLEALTSVGGRVLINGNTALTSLDGLDALTSVGDYLFILNNDALTSLTALGALTSVGGYLNVYLNDTLPSLDGLGAVTSVGGFLAIARNAALTSLDGLGALTSVGEYISIFNNDALTSLTGLEGITSVGEHLLIDDNDALTSLDGLINITSVGGDLTIQRNDLLTACACVLKGLATETSPGTYALTDVGGTITIENNGGPTCDTPAAVLAEMAGCAVGADCTDPATAPAYAGGYVLNSTQTRAFVVVTAPAGATAFEFYNTSNLVVADPEVDAEGGTLLAGLTRVGDTFSFGAGDAPAAAFFPVKPMDASNTHVAFFLRVTDSCGRTVDVDPAFTLTGVERQERPGFALSAAIPSPTLGEATIRFSLDQAGRASLVVYDVLGREVARLADGMLSEGAHAARLDGADLPSGLYVYRLVANGQALTRTLTVAR